MSKVLLVTNDFPPTVGGIQSYLRDFVEHLGADEIAVFASTQDAEVARAHDAALGYRVHRWSRRVMLPTPATAREMARVIAEEGAETVWFGAAAPLGLLADAARRAGARRIVATTHGHEVGWSMLPGARRLLRRIFRRADVVTYISDYTRRRLARLLRGTELVHLPSGVDTDLFRPIDDAARADVRASFGVGAEAPLVVVISRLVPRKGQDQLIRAWPAVRGKAPGARLLVVGRGRYESTLRVLSRRAGEGVELTGPLDFDRMRALLAAADVAAMPARTRFGGLDVEGLGIVYLEAQSSGVPVLAGRSGGAPETVTPETGVVVDGCDLPAIEEALVGLLSDPERRARMGRAGRAHAEGAWSRGEMDLRLRRALGLGEGPGL